MLRSGGGLEACTSITQNGVCSVINLPVCDVGRYILAVMDVWCSVAPLALTHNCQEAGPSTVRQALYPSGLVSRLSIYLTFTSLHLTSSSLQYPYYHSGLIFHFPSKSFVIR